MIVVSSNVSECDTETEDYLTEILDKGVAGVWSLVAQRGLLVLFSFVVTSLGGAGVYGVLSVLMRFLKLSGRPFSAVITSLNRTLPRHSFEEKRQVITATGLILVGYWGVVGGLILFFADEIVSQTLLTARHRPAVQLVAVGLLPFLVVTGSAATARALKHVRLGVFLRYVGIPLSMLGGVGGSFLLGASTDTYLWGGIVVAIGVMAVVAAVFLTHRTQFAVSRVVRTTVVREYVQYTGDVSVYTMIGIAQRQSVFVIMAVILSPVDAGLFSLALILSNIARWPLAGVNQIYAAVMTDIYDTDQIDVLQRLHRQTSRIAATAAVPIVVALSVFGEEILVIFSDAYTGFGVVVAVITIGQYVATVIGSTGLLLLVTDNQRQSTIVKLLTTLIVLPAAVVLTMEFGVVGLAVGYCLSLIIDNVSQVALLRWIEDLSPLSVNHLYITVLGLLMGVTVIVCKLLLSPIASAPYVALFGGIYLQLVYNRILTEQERRAIKNVIGR